MFTQFLFPAVTEFQLPFWMGPIYLTMRFHSISDLMLMLLLWNYAMEIEVSLSFLNIPRDIRNVCGTAVLISWQTVAKFICYRKIALPVCNAVPCLFEKMCTYTNPIIPQMSSSSLIKTYHFLYISSSKITGIIIQADIYMESLYLSFSFS